MLEFLPIKIKSVLSKINVDKLQEVRIRKGLPVKIKFDFKDYFLTEKGLSNIADKPIIICKTEIDNIVENLTNFSLYAHNDRLKEGFLISNDGERVGVLGEFVEGTKDNTIKEITSLLVRVPHEIIGISDKIKNIMNNQVKNLLIISPPGNGKTTILKDLIRNYQDKNLLVIDERGELYQKNIMADYIRFSNKLTGFTLGIRSLSPDIVVVDELIGENDYKMCYKAVNSGVKLFATIHNDKIPNDDILREIFDYYIIINSQYLTNDFYTIYDRHNNILK